MPNDKPNFSTEPQAAKQAARAIVNPYLSAEQRAKLAAAIKGPAQAAPRIVNPYAKAKQPVAAATEAAKPAAHAIVNPYLEKPRRAAVYNAHDVMFNSEKFTDHVNARNIQKLPPTGYERATQDGPDPRTLGFEPDAETRARMYLNGAYFKVGHGQFVTLERHKELLDKPLKRKVGPPADILAYKVVLLRDPTGTKLVSPQALEKLDPTFAQNAFKDLNLHTGKSINGQTINNKISSELLFTSDKSKIKNITTNYTNNDKKLKNNQIFVAVDGANGDRQFIDLRGYLKEKPVATLSERSLEALKRVTDGETWDTISTIITQQRGQAIVAHAVPDAGDDGTHTGAEQPTKRLKLGHEDSVELNSNLDERPRGSNRNGL